MDAHVLKQRNGVPLGAKVLATVLVVVMAIIIIRDILARRPALDYGSDSNAGLPAE